MLFFFFPQVNKRRGLLLKVSKNLEVRLGKTNKKKNKNRRYSRLVSVSINWFFFFFVLFNFFEGEISTQHPHSEPHRAGMYPLDPALHSFLANKTKKKLTWKFFCITKRLYGVQANSPTKLTTVIFSWFFSFTKFH